MGTEGRVERKIENVGRLVKLFLFLCDIYICVTTFVDWQLTCCTIFIELFVKIHSLQVLDDFGQRKMMAYIEFFYILIEKTNVKR